MKKCILAIIILGIFSLNGTSQTIDHWETVVFDDDIWKYFEGTSEPDTNWRKLAFNDSSWLQGQGGIGYGDSDDNTIITSTLSLYLRKNFTIVDTSKIEALGFKESLSFEEGLDLTKKWVENDIKSG